MHRPNITLVVYHGLMAGIWFPGTTAPVQETSPTSATELMSAIAATYGKSAEYEEAMVSKLYGQDWDPVHRFDPHRAPKAKKYGRKPPIRRHR